MSRTFDEKLNMVKWIGILTMTIDHVGYFLFPGLLWMRMIGRIAFPCFLYSTIEGTERTSDYKKYITRLFGLGVLSMLVTPNTINVLFLLGLFSLSLKYRRYFPLFMLLSFIAEYSVYGFLFGWHILDERKRSSSGNSRISGRPVSLWDKYPGLVSDFSSFYVHGQRHQTA